MLDLQPIIDRLGAVHSGPWDVPSPVEPFMDGRSRYYLRRTGRR